VSSIQQLLDDVTSLPGRMERASVLNQVDERLRDAQSTKRSFKMEIRLIIDVQEGRLQKMDQELRTLRADLRALQAEEERGELFLQSGGGDEGVEVDAATLGNNMLKDASGLQDKTQESLTNTRKMIAASKEVGVSTLEELHRQRGVIQNIDKETDRMDDNLARAEALVKRFGKRMAGDKFIQCFAVLNCLLLVGVVIFVVTKDGGLGGDGDDATPFSPVRRMLRGA
jgi:hypothetical protein